ncbi:unnamed protein product [Phytophthora lilii]|uniref:Unnamed protein product n=1 Tax=Phytophthora lilii TaxID=2077276 RepID=A0A9W6TPB4_9STRA|nr:unnamed protein product [Phytophthora lilii]
MKRRPFSKADATIIAAEFEQTWLAMALIFLADPRGSKYRDETDDPDNTTAVRFTSNCTESGSSTTLVLTSVTRQYVEADRVIFVWRVLAEHDGEFESLVSDETGWVVLRPSTKQVNGQFRFATTLGTLFADSSHRA